MLLLRWRCRILPCYGKNKYTPKDDIASIHAIIAARVERARLLPLPASSGGIEGGKSKSGPEGDVTGIVAGVWLPVVGSGTGTSVGDAVASTIDGICEGRSEGIPLGLMVIVGCGVIVGAPVAPVEGDIDVDGTMLGASERNTLGEVEGDSLGI